MNHEANTALILMPASDPDDDVSIDGILTIQLQMVRQALRRETRAFERTRDDDLRNKIQRKPEPWAFALETHNRCREKSAALLRRARSQLHKAIDDLIGELEAETSAAHHVPRQEATPITPVSGARFHEPAPGPGPERPPQPRAPVAEMDCDVLAAQGNRARSVTMPIFEHPAPVVSDLPIAGPSTSVAGRPGAAHTPPAPPPPQSKRPGADTAATTPSKRAKTTNTATPGKAATASKIVTLQTPTKTTPTKGKRADSAKKSAARVTAPVNLDANEEYMQSQSQSDDDLEQIEEIGRRELAHRAAKAKNVVYKDQPLGENEFVV